MAERRHFLPDFGRLARIYWTSPQAKHGALLLVLAVGLELGTVYGNVQVSGATARIGDALQTKDAGAFFAGMGVFFGLALVFALVSAYRVYVRQVLEMRWRQGLTAHYVDRWIGPEASHQSRATGGATDNPDQRIAEDIQMFIERTLSVGVGLLGALVTLGSFVIILWSLSAAAPLHLFGSAWDIPGYLVWAALIYAIAGTWLTHLIGWPLVGLNFQQQRFEADFRFNLVRVRENSEQIALLDGEHAENSRLLDRFSRVVGNWLLIMSRTKRLTFFTSGYSQISIIFPYVVVSPAYFAGAMQLGGLMQTASAFNSVQTALSFFVNAYRTLAEWRAVIARLDGFELAVLAGQAAARTPPRIEVQPTAEQSAVALEHLAVNLPSGAPVVAADAIVVPPGEHVLVNGPSGAGKSMLFRAIAGIWPFGSGRVARPRRARLMMLPQRPYFPVGTLAAAISYPAEPGTYDRARLTQALNDVGLPALADRLDEEAHWNRMLSPGEQQRLGIARALLQAPDILFLDEATASLDEPAEAALYRLMQQRLPAATIVSIGHRSTLQAFHGRRLALEREGDRFRVGEAALRPAAE
jgi:putative ATP-binding cassette transporter